MCDAFRMRKAEAATRIEAYLEEVKLKEWEKDGTVGRVRPDGSGSPKNAADAWIGVLWMPQASYTMWPW